MIAGAAIGHGWAEHSLQEPEQPLVKGIYLLLI